MAIERTRCTGSVHGMHDDPDRAGRCPFCGQQVAYPMARPKRSLPNGRPELDRAYEYYYDPDFGLNQYDSY